MVEEELTRSALFDFLCGGSEYIQHLDRYFHHFIRHCQSKWDRRINLEPSEETFHPSEKVDKDILARSDIFSCLGTLSIH